MYDRKRIRRPRTEPPELAALQAARGPHAFANDSSTDSIGSIGSTANPGHNFSRIAVTPPAFTERTAQDERFSSRHAFVAHIPWAASVDVHGALTPDANRQADGERDDSKQPVLPSNDDPGGGVPVPAEDETEELPFGGGAAGGARGIRSTLGFTGSLTDVAANPPGGEFGATTYKALPLTAVEVKTGKRGFTVTATEELEINVQVCPGNGPQRQIHIAGDDDPAITHENYLKVAADLTPDPKDHVPLRSHYWARDLVYRHEHFHAKEDTDYGAEGTRQAQGWLNKQRVKSEQAAQGLLDYVPGMVEEHIRNNMQKTAREQRAYDDGAPEYQARADAIKKKGDSGKYPPPSP
jgi:hypothetical protein